MLINWSFISQLEGGRRLIGYVPARAAGDSGVTVATAIDLGAFAPQDIEAMAIPETLKDKLKPYAGLKGEAARTALEAQPLGLTSDEAEALDEAVKTPIVHALVAGYNAAVQDNGLERFEGLPEAAQTVIAAVAFQYGADLSTRLPHFWGCVCAQDWPASVAELEKQADARHRREADLLRSVYQ